MVSLLKSKMAAKMHFYDQKLLKSTFKITSEHQLFKIIHENGFED